MKDQNEPMTTRRWLQAMDMQQPLSVQWDRLALKGMIRDLILEVERLKRGAFTEQEFQELCHNLPGHCTREAFEKGCRDYQNKLFGPKEGAE